MIEETKVTMEVGEETKVEEVEYLSPSEVIKDVKQNYKRTLTPYNCFSGADTIVGINEEVQKDINHIEVHKRYNLSTENFCATIPDLYASDLDSIKNLDGIVIIESVISEKELEIPDGCTVQLGFANEHGYKLKKEVKDCYIIKRSLRVSEDTITVVERIILAAGYVGAIEKFEDDKVDGK